MTDKTPCTMTQLAARVTALETHFIAFEKLLDERDKRYQQRSDGQDKSVSTAMDASKEAIIKAETATEKRLESLNELRGAMADQSKDFARLAEMNLLFSAVEKRITAITDLVQTQISRGTGMKDLGAYVVAGAGLLIAMAAVWFKR